MAAGPRGSLFSHSPHRTRRHVMHYLPPRFLPSSHPYNSAATMGPANKIGPPMKSLALTLCLLAFSAPVWAVTPEAAWKADLADTNKAYTATPHAILKIQDAAYLGEGDRASLVGKPGMPGSYKWVSGARGDAVLVAAFTGGKPVITKNGNALGHALADVAVDKD